MKRMIVFLTIALAMTTAAFGQMQMSPTPQPKAEKINSKQICPCAPSGRGQTQVMAIP